MEEAFPAAGQKEVKARTIAMWSTIQGFLALARAGRIAPIMIEPLSQEETVKAVLDVAMGWRGGAGAADATSGTAGRARAKGSFGKALDRLGLAPGTPLGPRLSSLLSQVDWLVDAVADEGAVLVET